MNLSNSIAGMIIDMLEEKDEIEFQRNILAQSLGCVPSQINYVLSSRFTPEQGYIVESRRGGKGCIRIVRVSCDKDTLIMQVINSAGECISEETARNHIANLLYHRILTEGQASIIISAIKQSHFKVLPSPLGDMIRASIFKQMLLTVADNSLNK